MTRVNGTIEKIIFRNEDNDYTVLAFENDDGMFTGVGHIKSPYIGESLTLSGEWTHHRRFGTQFQFDRYEAVLPKTEAQIMAYLSSGILPGIRKKTAKALIDAFGEDVLEVMDHEPERLLSVPGIGKKTLVRIVTAREEQRELGDVLMALQQYDISAAVALKLFKVYGSQTVSVLLGDPYAAIKDVRGVGFALADQFAAKLGVDKHHPKRVRAGIVQGLRGCYAAGDTYMFQDELIAGSAKLLDVPEALVKEQLSEVVLDGMAEQAEVNGKTAFFPMNLYAAEDELAMRLVALSRHAFSDVSLDFDREINRFEKKMGIVLDDCQKAAVGAAVTGGVVIITGGPGTGKTTIINAILNLMTRAMKLNVTLTAPTGRAAKRMTETTGREARTIHRLLEYDYQEDGSDFLSFQRDEDNPLDDDCVIVDEASMIGTMLMNSLLAALRPGTRLVLVGDADQLPSVEPGNVLADLIDSESVPVIRLDTIHRQSKKSMISLNARSINHGEVPAIDNHSDFVFIRQSTQSAIAREICALIGTRLAGSFDIDPVRDIQVIAPFKKGEAGVNELNVSIQAVLNPPSDRKREKQFGSVVFRAGDKVMQIANNYKMEWESTKSDERGKGVFNGDIGWIADIDDAEKQITVHFTDDRIARYDFDQHDELMHAFAITVHKSQGSEFPFVIMPMIFGFPDFLNRKLLYTAVTRAKRMMILVGEPSAFVNMIHSNKSAKRKTGLIERIKAYEAMV